MALRANIVLPSTPSTPKNGPEPLMMGNDVMCEKVNYLSISVRMGGYHVYMLVGTG